MAIKWIAIMFMGFAFAIAFRMAASDYSQALAFSACLKKGTPEVCSAALGMAAGGYNRTLAFNTCLQKGTPEVCSSAVSKLESYHNASTH